MDFRLGNSTPKAEGGFGVPPLSAADSNGSVCVRVCDENKWQMVASS